MFQKRITFAAEIIRETCPNNCPLKQIIREILQDQHKFLPTKKIIDRAIPEVYLQGDEVVMIVGARMCGKSAMLKQIMRKKYKNGYYVSFDDNRFCRFTRNDFRSLQEVLISLYGEQDAYFLNEITDIDGWEDFVKELHDAGKKVFATSSHWDYLSPRFVQLMKGHYLKMEVFPLSFREFITFRERTPLIANHKGPAKSAELQTLYNDYIYTGGIPMYVLTGEEFVRSTLFRHVFYRDVMARNQLTFEKELRAAIFFVMSNIGVPITYTMVAEAAGVKNVTTAKSYVECFEHAFFIKQVLKMDEHRVPMPRSPRCIYSLDPGLMRVGYTYNNDAFPYVASVVCQELLRRGYEVYNYQGSTGTCDFLAWKDGKVVMAIQVLCQWEDNRMRSTKLKGLTAAMETFDLEEGILVADAPVKEMAAPAGMIQIAPPWEWLLE